MAQSFDDVLRAFNLITLNHAMKKKTITTNWIAPPSGVLKFNVDGSAYEKPGPAGIGGVLQDEAGAVKLIFSKSIGIADSNVVELLAVKEAFLVFVASKWGRTHGLMIESDSLNAVKWINYPDLTPWKLKNYVAFIEAWKQDLVSWQISHINMECNEIADGLAKAGVNRNESLLMVLG
ncbi:hypothetical protein REPUB_Repub13aG0041100 [Reevesia pubescens]